MDTLNAPGFSCAECETEERVTGPRFTAAVELRLRECEAVGHHVTVWGFDGKEDSCPLG